METIFLILKITYAVFIISVVTGVILWSMKNGQFVENKNARNLPLEAGPLYDEQKKKKGQ